MPGPSAGKTRSNTRTRRGQPLQPKSAEVEYRHADPARVSYHAVQLVGDRDDAALLTAQTNGGATMHCRSYRPHGCRATPHLD
jgi:hypothetical protein